MIFGYDKEDYLVCKNCFYKISKPFPKICPNPNCLKPLEEEEAKEKKEEKSAAGSFADNIMNKNIQKQMEPNESGMAERLPPDSSHVKEIEISKKLASKKIRGVKIKRKPPKANLNDKVVVVPTSGQYFKNFGIVTEDRITLYNKNADFSYISELSANLDYIASSILEGEINRLILRSEKSNAIEKILYIKENGILFFIYGMFPDKQGYWLLNEMTKKLKDANHGQDKEFKDFDKLELNSLSRNFDNGLKSILRNYIQLESVMTSKELPTVAETLRFDYVGMSYKSIGIISKIFGDDLVIEMARDVPPEQKDDLQESMITAQIEAIAANTIANTQAIPVYLSVRLGYEKYRYLLFEKLRNDYYLYMLAEGNIKKYQSVVEVLVEMTDSVIDNPFKGDLAPFSKLKKQFIEFFQIRIF